MTSLPALTTFLGWCVVINLVIYTLSAVALMVFKGLLGSIAGRLFGVDPQYARNESFAWLARYKLLLVVLFLAPYLALKLMV